MFGDIRMDRAFSEKALADQGETSSALEEVPLKTPFEKAIAKLHAEIDEIERLREESKGPCIECKYFMSYGLYAEYCTCPIVTGMSYDPVRGKSFQKDNVKVDEARGKKRACGPEGLCFVRKEEKPVIKEERKSWWKRLLSRNEDSLSLTL
jgi:hypothetical protein